MIVTIRRVKIFFLCLLSVVGCIPLPLPSQPPVFETLTPAPPMTETPTPVSSPVATVVNQPSLTIWWPDVLMPTVEDQPLPLYEQLEAFAQTENGVQVKVRVKRVSDVGGIMATLRTAREVAPSALPDMTLLRRQDLLDAVHVRGKRGHDDALGCLAKGTIKGRDQVALAGDKAWNFRVR